MNNNSPVSPTEASPSARPGRWYRRINLFLVGLPAAIFLAWCFPGPGSRAGLFTLSTLSLVGVSAVFFGYGLRTDWDQFMAGIRLWRMHLLIQFITFLLFPLLIFPWKWVLVQDTAQQIWLGIFFLAALPSTISSSAVLVSMAGGNLPLAVVNAGLSGLIGILATPFWMVLTGSHFEGGWGALGLASLRLSVIIFLPMLVGAALTPWLGVFARRYERFLRMADQMVVMLIVYTSFSKSFERGLPAVFTVTALAAAAVAVSVLFLVVAALILGFCRLRQIPRPETLTVFFCGCTKSLSHGVVMAKVLFGSQPMAALVIVPVMFYHFIQLTVLSLVAAAVNRPFSRRFFPPE